MKEVAASAEDLPFDMPFDDMQDAYSSAVEEEDIPAPSDEDVPDDEYVDDDDPSLDDDMPF